MTADVCSSIRKLRLRNVAVWFGLVLLVVSAPGRGALWAQQVPPQTLTAQVVLAERYDVSPPLAGIKPIQPVAQIAGEEIEIPFRVLPKALKGAEAPQALEQGIDDAVLEGARVTGAMPAPSLTFEGVNNVNGVLPPDTNGDVGPNHYVQMVNTSFAIWNRSGTLLYGPANNSTLWSGFGGECESNNDGDPIVLYDQIADRWLMSQFAVPSSGPYYECIAISTTGDPTGAWYRYAFVAHATKMNDYPKLGVWPDGYYMTANQFVGCGVTCSWSGAGVWAFERDRMLLGQSAQMVYFDLYSVNPNFGGMLPSDLDGAVPPAGTPNYFMEVDDTTFGFATDRLSIWEFHVDWTTPANSTFGLSGLPNQVLDTAAFDPNLCGYSRNCIPQPGTSEKLDAISDRLMFRLQYRKFGSYATLVANHTVDVDGADHAGIRWYEVRNSGSGWSIQQQGTYAPDSDHRWMGSAAMNADGSIALGYSVSSAATSPSIRYAGRRSSNAAGTMGQGEAVMYAGAGSQTHTAHRWGDYSMMAVDPFDDRTFWYTNEYYQATSSASWRSRIGKFQVPLPSFTDDPLVAGTTTVKAVHIAELRTRIDAVRATYGREPYSWNDASLTAGASTIRVVHITDLRTALSEAYVAAGMTAPTFTPSDLAGVTVQAAHITQLRMAVVAIE